MTIPRPRRVHTVLAFGLASVLALSLLGPVGASSHREAPLIAEDPVADNTDVFAFRSPDRPDSVTLISNWIPFQQPQSGPYFYNFGEEVLYKINVDNNGDAVEDVVYEWRFTTTVDEDPAVPVYNVGPITSLDDEDWLFRQTYTLSVVEHGERRVLGTDLPVPPYNVGPRSTPDYEALAQAAIADIETPHGTLRSFAGPRDDPFAIDLGAAFDLLTLRPFDEAHAIDVDDNDSGEPGIDGLAGNNIHTIAIQVPIEGLTDGDPVIGVWSTTERRRARVFAGQPGGEPIQAGRFVQISRLGNPLVNELVVPTATKDTFNGLEPAMDAEVLTGLQAPPFATEGDIPLVTDPIVSELIEVLYPGVVTPPPPRDDLVSIFLLGIEGLNRFSGDFQPAEYLRLNTSIEPTPFHEQNRLGLLAGQNDGFPNGRRPIDDVTDIELRALAGGTPFTPEFNIAPNNQLGDGVPYNDRELPTTFPYISTPWSGFESPYLPPATEEYPYEGEGPSDPINP